MTMFVHLVTERHGTRPFAMHCLVVLYLLCYEMAYSSFFSSQDSYHVENLELFMDEC